MEEDKKQIDKRAKLRDEAEKTLVEALKNLDAPEIKARDIKELIHELQVYSIELELQNEELKDANYQLEVSRNRFSDLFDYAPVGYLIIDTDGLITNANLTFCNLLGLPKEKVLGKKLYSFTNNEYKDDLFKYLRRFFSTESTESLEIVLNGGGNTNIYVLLEITTSEEIVSTNDECRIAVSDISDLKKLEYEKHLLQDKFQVITELTSDYTYEYKIDQNNKLEFEWVSGAFEKITGFTFAEIEKLGGWIKLVHPEDLHIAKLRKEKLKSGSEDECEYRIICKDNSVKWLRDFGKPITENGKINLIIGGAKDITKEKESELQLKLNHNATLNLVEDLAKENEERRIAEESLRKSEERYRLITNVASDYVFSSDVDKEGTLKLNWVAGAFEEITGYTFEGYNSNGGWLASLYPDDVKIDEQDMDTLKKNENVNTELRTISKNGNIIWVKVYAQPVWDYKEEKLIGIYGAVQDITKRKLAEEALIEKMNELQKFNTLMVGRELKMVELKKEINDLFVKTGKQPKYDVDFEN